MSNPKEDKKALLQDLIHAHEKELELSLYALERLQGVPAFEDALERERARMARLEEVVRGLRAQAELFRKPMETVETGALVIVNSSHTGPHPHLVVSDTEIEWFKSSKTGADCRALKAHELGFTHEGEDRTSRTGRPGEETEVTEVVVKIL